jgi:anti-sigma factor RsiW
MASANCKITAELISDYAAGRLDVEEVQVMEAASNRDEDVAAAVAAARRLDARMTTALAASKLGVPKPRLGVIPCRPLGG